MPRWEVHFNTHVQSGKISLVERLAQARALARVMRGIPVPPYVEDRLHKLNILRAVRGTTSIEGTEASEEEVGQIIDAPEDERVLPPSRARDEQEVRNAKRLMDHITEILRVAPDQIITEELIRHFHAILTKGIDYPNNAPGRYRTAGVHAGSYLAPDHGLVAGLMTEFVQWFNGGRPMAWDPIVRAIVAHFYLVSIHPFGDGNGRTSRGVEAFLLARAGVNVRGFYSLANYYYRNRDDYVRMLDLVRFESDPDLTPFVDFAVYGLSEELVSVNEDLLAEVRVIAFRDFAREGLERAGRLGTKTGERQLRFLLMLDTDPVSLRDIRADRHALASLYEGVTSKTLTRDVNFLKSLGLILVKGDELRANIEVMLQYTAGQTPPAETKEQESEGNGQAAGREGADSQMPLFSS